MFEEFKELLSSFNARNVRYLVVGGYAVSLHARPRSTEDIDILIAADPENAQTISGLSMSGLSAAEGSLTHCTTHFPPSQHARRGLFGGCRSPTS